MKRKHPQVEAQEEHSRDFSLSAFLFLFLFKLRIAREGISQTEPSGMGWARGGIRVGTLLLPVLPPPPPPPQKQNLCWQHDKRGLKAKVLPDIPPAGLLGGQAVLDGLCRNAREWNAGMVPWGSDHPRTELWSLAVRVHSLCHGAVAHGARRTVLLADAISTLQAEEVVAAGQQGSHGLTLDTQDAVMAALGRRAAG